MNITFNQQCQKVLKKALSRACILFKQRAKAKDKVQLLGSGAILNEVIAAAELLKKDFDIAADVWSVTSFNELRRDGVAVERANMLHPEKKPAVNLC